LRNDQQQQWYTFSNPNYYSLLQILVSRTRKESRMSKLKCICGHNIVDQTDFLSYKAEYFSDEDNELYYGKLTSFLEKLVKEPTQDREDQFADGRFTEKHSSRLALSDEINDFLAGLRMIFAHDMYECEQCGRLWIQPDPARNELVPYLPETNQRGILKSHRNSP